MMQIKPEFVFARVIVWRFQKLFLCFYSMKGFSLFMIIDTTLRQCLPICFLTSDLTIRNKNLKTLRTVGLKSGIKEIVTAFNYDDTLFVLLVIVQLFHGDEDHVLCGELTSLLKLKAIWDVVRRSNIIFVSSILRVRKKLLKNF